MTPSSDVLGGVFVGFVAFWQCSGRLFIKRRVVCVVVFAVKAFAGLVQGFCEALVVHQLALAQETDDVLDVGVVGKTQDIVVGGARLLLCYYHVFATKSWCVKVRKILILQGFTALLKLTIF